MQSVRVDEVCARIKERPPGNYSQSDYRIIATPNGQIETSNNHLDMQLKQPGFFRFFIPRPFARPRQIKRMTACSY